MKRITFSGNSIITGSAVAVALLEYATHIALGANSVAVDIPVLEMNGKKSVHTLLLGPSSQFDVSDVDGLSSAEETEAFPVPEFPPIGDVGVSEPSPETEADAEQFNDAVAFIDGGLDELQ